MKPGMVRVGCWKCGGEIYRAQSKIDSSVTKRFVCSSCYSRGRGEYTECANSECCVTFYVYPSDIERGRKYCSQRCTKDEQRKPFYGNKSTGKDGYVRVKMPDHPNANKDGRLMEHTLVMSQVLGRPLRPDEEVHHLNGVRGDNRPNNLELWDRSKQPAGQRVEDRVSWAKEILRTYEPDYVAEEWW